MSEPENDFELVHGSGNIYRDLGFPDADIRQFKADLAAQILAVLEAERISVREAAERTGYAAADFSRVRQAKIRGFTIDRLVAMLSKLDQEQDVVLTVERRPRHAPQDAPRPA